jgi:hypothetical protein
MAPFFRVPGCFLASLSGHKKEMNEISPLWRRDELWKRGFALLSWSEIISVYSVLLRGECIMKRDGKNIE